MTQRPTITIFADFTCPFSYLAEQAIGRLAGGGIEVVARAFELYPDPAVLPRPELTQDERRAIDGLATSMGVRIELPGFRPSTRKAHEAARIAAAAGVGTEYREAVYAAYFVAGRDIGRIDVLAELGGSVGLDPEDLRIALDIDRERDAVIHDEEIAVRLGIDATPTIFFGTGAGARVAIGALAPEEIEQLVEGMTTNRSEQTSDG